jgi:hypothetical protein
MFVKGLLEIYYSSLIVTACDLDQRTEVKIKLIKCIRANACHENNELQ